MDALDSSPPSLHERRPPTAGRKRVLSIPMGVPLPFTGLELDPGDCALRLAEAILAAYHVDDHEKADLVREVAELRSMRQQLRLFAIVNAAIEWQEYRRGNKPWPEYLKILARRLGEWVKLQEPLESAARALWSTPGANGQWLILYDDLGSLRWTARGVVLAFRRGEIHDCETSNYTSILSMFQNDCAHVQQVVWDFDRTRSEETERGPGYWLGLPEISERHSRVEALRFRLEDEMAVIRQCLAAGHLERAWDELFEQTKGDGRIGRSLSISTGMTIVEAKLGTALADLNSAELIARKQRKGQGLQLTLPLFPEPRASM